MDGLLEEHHPPGRRVGGQQRGNAAGPAAAAVLATRRDGASGMRRSGAAAPLAENALQGDAEAEEGEDDDDDEDDSSESVGGEVDVHDGHGLHNEDDGVGFWREHLNPDAEQENGVRRIFSGYLRQLRENRCSNCVLQVASPNESRRLVEALWHNHTLREMDLEIRAEALSQDGIDGVCDFVRTSASLRELNLRRMPHVCFRGLLRAVRENPRIESLTCDLKGSKVAPLVDLIGSSSTLRRLRVDFYAMTDEKTRLLAAAIASESTCLRELELQVPERCAATILDAIPADHPLQDISLVFVRTPEICEALRRVLRTTTTLQKLFLSEAYGDGEDPHPASDILSALRCNDTVRYLRWDSPALTRSEEVQLLDLVRSRRTLVEFGLHDAEVEDKDAFWDGLFWAIGTNGSIRNITLHCPLENVDSFTAMITDSRQLEELEVYFFKETVFTSTVEAVAGHPTLRTLELRPVICRIDDLEPLTTALSRSSLHQLRLQFGFQLSPGGGAKQLADHLSSGKCSLSHLEVRNCNIDAEGLEVLFAGLASGNHRLETLVIAREDDGDRIRAADHPSLARGLLYGLQANRTLMRVEMTHVELGSELADAVSFYCLRNRYREVARKFVSSRLPVLVGSLLRRGRLGRSVLMHYMKDGVMELGCGSRKRSLPIED